MLMSLAIPPARSLPRERLELGAQGGIIVDDQRLTPLR
jgi:hypothetical protein